MKNAVRNATIEVFEELPESFRSPLLCEMVRCKVFPKRPMDSTILRQLRQLRQESILNYEIVGNKALANYEKK